MSGGNSVSRLITPIDFHSPTDGRVTPSGPRSRRANRRSKSRSIPRGFLKLGRTRGGASSSREPWVLAARCLVATRRGFKRWIYGHSTFCSHVCSIHLLRFWESAALYAGGRCTGSCNVHSCSSKSIERDFDRLLTTKQINKSRDWLISHSLTPRSSFFDRVETEMSRLSVIIAPSFSHPAYRGKFDWLAGGLTLGNCRSSSARVARS